MTIGAGDLHTCHQCGLPMPEMVALSWRKRKFCTTACREKHQLGGRIAEDRKCDWCGNAFIAYHWRQRYCSLICRKHPAIIGEYIERVKAEVVLERDKYVCQICGVQTDAELRGSSHPSAPEVDHVIPINWGGQHSYQNVQCACRKCNRDKGDKIGYRFGT